MPQDDILYKQLKERYQQMLQELFVHGDKSNTNVVAYQGNVWLLPDDNIPPETVHDIFQKIGMEYTKDISGTWGFHDLNSAIDDSERYDVLVGYISDKTLNIFSHGSFVLDPKSSILIQKVVKTLKLQKVSYTETEDTTTVPKKKITGQIPDYAFHGTSSEYLESILRSGLEPRGYQSNYSKQGIYHEDLIFFTTRFGEASHHATHTASLKKGLPIVLELRIPDKNLIVPDYDIDVQSGETMWQDTRQHGGKLGSKKSDSMSREFGIYGYRGKILPQHIRYIYVVLDRSNEYPIAKDYKRFTTKQIRKFVDQGMLEVY